MPERWLREVLSAALNIAVPGGQTFEVSLVVTGDEAVRELNREYRGLDEVTDVLSFSPMHSGHWEGDTPQVLGALDGASGTEFVYPPGELAPLGEIIISFPQAQRQATERSQPLDLDLALLIVHGVLHLVGHDHAEPTEESEMKSKEQAALKMIPRLDITDAPNQRLIGDRQPKEVRQ